MSVWVSEGDGHDRMQHIVSEAKRDCFQRLDELQKRIDVLVELLKVAAPVGLTPEECKILLATLSGPSRERGVDLQQG